MSVFNALSIIVPSIVTPAVVAWFARSQERAMRRRDAADELRSVIDDAARRLAVVDPLLRRYNNAWRFGSTPEGEMYERTAIAVSDVEHVADRLIIRLGDDAMIVHAYNAALNTIFRYYSRLQTGVREGQPYPTDGSLREFYARLEATRSRFMAEAKLIVGHDLGRYPRAETPPPPERVGG
jgi:hypothetical protein